MRSRRVAGGQRLGAGIALLLLGACQSLPGDPPVVHSVDRIDSRIWFEAAEAGDSVTLSTMLEVGIDPLIERQGLTALHVAASAGRLEAVRLLVDAGAGLDLGPDETQARLADAAGHGNWNLLEMVSGRELDPEVVATAVAVRTPLNLAIEGGHADVAALLVDAGADVNAGGEWYSPLVNALLAGDAKLVELLLEHGARVNDAVRVHDRSVFTGFRYVTPAEVARIIERDDLVTLMRTYGGR